jgi:serine/threonine protein kinase
MLKHSHSSRSKAKRTNPWDLGQSELPVAYYLFNTQTLPIHSKAGIDSKAASNLFFYLLAIYHHFMAEDHFNTSISALGGAVTLAKGILNGLAFGRRIGSSDQSIQRFKILLDLQEARFILWAEEWGIKQSPHTRDRNIRMHQAKIVVPYLQQIEQITCKLNDDFNATLPALSENSQSLRMLGAVAPHLTSSSSNPCVSDTPDTISITSMEKIKWMMQERKLNDGLTLLRSLLDELYLCFPIRNMDAAGPVLHASSLRSQDPTTLAHIGRVIDDPLEQGLAFSKSLVYMPSSAQTNVSHLDPKKLVQNSPGDDTPSRFLGTYDGRLVLVEKKSSKIHKNATSQSVTINARIENIIMRLQHEKKPDQPRTLPCCGVANVYSSAGAGGEWFVTNYNIVYNIDTPTFFTLRELLSQSHSNKSEVKGRKPRGARTGIALGQRFIIGRTLASAVMCLHLADWLHKAIRSENILFFGDSMADAGSTLPYLVGFEYSRPDTPGERTEDIVDKDEYVYYRHPDAHFVPVADLEQPLGGAGRYSKVYDIYSLGVILVELGLFKSARSIVRSYTGSRAAITGEGIRKALLDEGMADLKFHMGEVYANAARVCLDGFFDRFDTYDLPGAFSKHVVRPLSSCQA